MRVRMHGLGVSGLEEAVTDNRMYMTFRYSFLGRHLRKPPLSPTCFLNY